MPPPPPLLECVVNVSEGRDPATLDAFGRAIEAVTDCYLLHRDVGSGAHRTVFTLAGSPEAVFTAARAVYRVAAERIDLREHVGEHPRIGAVDVCPFVPIRGTDLEATVARTRVLGEWLAATFDLPVFLYESSATSEHRRSLAAIRRGGPAGLTERLRQPEWQPDFGPARLHPRLGATVIGARPFLIAWNINLAPGVPEAVARQLAARLRGSGAAGRPGLFPGLRAIGWTIPEYGRCQISCNVVDPDRTNLARVYLTAVDLARRAGAEVTGSELIGLVPALHLRAAARGFCAPDDDYATEMDTAVAVLGLDDLAPFDWRTRVLEEVIAKHKKKG